MKKQIQADQFDKIVTNGGNMSVCDLIRKNPFEFELVTVLVNDSVRREAVSREVERKFLKFVYEDTHFSRYYEGIYILFKTGMRISEFCGLTISDIDFKNHSINVNHQLQKRATVGYYIEEPKTEPMIDGRTGFPYFDKDGSVVYSCL